ncbi:MAG TPA: amino acid permease, partial [Sphingomicrobium sp.]|nr:amino acid permease [Sphingomicrobium sp.]
ILLLAAIFSLSGNLLGGTTATPRVTYAMAKRGDLPGWFATVNPKFLTPANSIAFLTVFAGLLAISGGFVWLAVVSTLARMLLYPLTILALAFAPARPRLTAFHWATGAAGIAICLWGATQADLKAWLTLGTLVAIGSVLYALASSGRRRALQ